MIQIEKIKSKKGDGLVVIVSVSLLFIVAFLVISLDAYTFYSRNVQIKSSLNLAVKASAMQIDTEKADADGNNLAAEGIFVIDEVEAEEALKQIIRQNLMLNEDFSPSESSILKKPLKILEFEVLNDFENMPYEHASPTLGQDYLISHPGVFVVCSFEVQSYFMQKEVTFAKLSAAELINIAED